MTSRSKGHGGRRAGIVGIIVLATALDFGWATAPEAQPSETDASVLVTGRRAVIFLPYRAADHSIWVSATKSIDAMPFAFKGLEIKPSAGPQGFDHAVFTFVADRAGTTTLVFGLVPPGQMLIGPPGLVYHGPVARSLSIPLTTD